MNHKFKDQKNEKNESGVVKELCDRLNKAGISYCHWKSNNALARSISGENDLDLLINRVDSQAFNEILLQLGFKQAYEKSGKKIPGILNYYGFDCDLGRIVHLHAHYQLILGHDATKNYHIPIEAAYLESSSLNGIFMVPAVEFELIILIIRLILKHYTLDAVLLGHTKLSTSEIAEIDYLSQHASENRVFDILKRNFPYINIQQYSDCYKILTTKLPLWRKIQVGHRLLKCLRPFARFPYAKDVLIKFWHRIYRPISIRIFRKDTRKQMNNGGLLIAIVGGDGAGKTTAVNEIYNWLSGVFSIYSFHMGKPKWSFSTIIIRGILKIGRSLGFYPFARAENQYTHDPDSLVFPGYPYLIRAICTAHDRYLTYIRARRLATNGGLVILDRFPLPQIKFMDGPHIAYITANLPRNRLLNYLINLEESYYRKMVFPDQLIVLRADPEIAVKRKVEESEFSVRARSLEIWEMDWKQIQANVVNANDPKDDVLKDIKNQIWSKL